MFLLCKQATFTLSHGLKCDLQVPSISKGFPPVTINLPKLEIKIFDGDVNKWPMFHESFHCSLHPNPNISNVQKMIYLKNLLTPNTAATTAAFHLCHENYIKALGLLKMTRTLK